MNWVCLFVFFLSVVEHLQEHDPRALTKTRFQVMSTWKTSCLSFHLLEVWWKLLLIQIGSYMVSRMSLVFTFSLEMGSFNNNIEYKWLLVAGGGIKVNTCLICDFKIRFNSFVFWMCLLLTVTSVRWQMHF